MIKKLRKFANIRLLCLSDNVDFKNTLDSKLKDCKENIIQSNITNSDFDINQYDIVILDYDIENSKTLLVNVRNLSMQIPIIVLVADANDEDILNCVSTSVSSVLSKPTNFVDLKISMIMALNQSKRVDKINLNNGIYYDSYRERFYSKEGAIQLTNYEYSVLKLLLDHKNEIISYDFIKDKVWKEKNMSIFTMRNIINKIRKKTYYGIIVNNSSAGYQIDTLQI